jgi:acyl carrier protein
MTAEIGAIRGFLAETLRVVGADEVDPELPLVQKGVIDSIELMQVVSFLEEHFGLEIDESEVVPANLRSLAAMAAFVRRKRDDGAAS